MSNLHRSVGPLTVTERANANAAASCCDDEAGADVTTLASAVAAAAVSHGRCRCAAASLNSLATCFVRLICCHLSLSVCLAEVAASLASGPHDWP